MSNHVGEKLKLVRSALGLSQAKFCETIDIGLSGYKKYEMGIVEPGYSVIEKFANNPATKMYTMWLLTGQTNPSAGQIAPGDKDYEAQLSDEQFEAEFVKTSVDALMMFCHLDWFRPNLEKPVDFDDCGKLLLKDLKPVINARFSNNVTSIKSA